MPGATNESLAGFAGAERIFLNYPGLNDALNVLDSMKPSELSTVMMHHWAVRAALNNNEGVLGGNQFTTPSAVSMRTMHLVEGHILSRLGDVEFVELAPLQPLGTSSLIAGTNQKMVMPGLRNCEVNSDATTGLFREAFRRYSGSNTPTHLATLARITRVQTFDPSSGFLPHFKMFAQVSIGDAPSSRGPEELERLADHLHSEVMILDSFSKIPGADISDIKVKIGNIVFVEDLISRGILDRIEVRKRTQDPTFDVLDRMGAKDNTNLKLSDDDLEASIKEVGLGRGVSVIGNFKDVITDKHPELLDRIKIDLGRVAGIGYYRHLCYRIEATTSGGLKLPLVDGGTTDWAKKMNPKNKYTYTVTSGIGTELLAKHFLQI